MWMIAAKIRKEPLAVSADATQLQQIIINLCTNAAHAMQEKDGVLEISLSNIDWDQDAATRPPELKPGPYLKLSVSDTGDGIEPQYHDKIFERFEQVDVHARAGLRPGSVIPGPAVIEDGGSTIWVPLGYAAGVRPGGELELRR